MFNTNLHQSILDIPTIPSLAPAGLHHQKSPAKEHTRHTLLPQCGLRYGSLSGVQQGLPPAKEILPLSVLVPHTTLQWFLYLSSALSLLNKTLEGQQATDMERAAGHHPQCSLVHILAKMTI